jgi:hypothetical protein
LAEISLKGFAIINQYVAIPSAVSPLKTWEKK